MIRKNKWKLLLLCLYAGLVIFGGVHHEPWRDEADVWYTAREASVVQTIDSAKYWGMPILWHLILMPFAKLGLPYITLTFINISIAIFAVALLLFFGEIPFFAKILFIFSYYMAYEYAVIARNYILVPLLLFAIASIYKKKLERPYLYAFLISLLFQVNDYVLIPAAALVLDFGIEVFKSRHITKKSLYSLAIMLIAGFMTLMMLTGNKVLYDGTYTNTNSVKAIPDIFKHLFNPIIEADYFYLPFVISDTGLVITGLFFILFLIIIFKNIRIFNLAIISLGWLFYFNIFIHQGSNRHHGLILVFIIFFLWISRMHKSFKFIIRDFIAIVFYSFFIFLSAISIFHTVNVFWAEYKYPFSAAKETAEYIKKNKLDRFEIVVHEGSFGEAVAVYFRDKKFWYPEYKGKGYFELNSTRYIDRLTKTQQIAAVAWVREKFTDTPVLLLLHKPIIQNPDNEFKLIKTIRSVYFWGNATENFYIYANTLAQKEIII